MFVGAPQRARDVGVCPACTTTVAVDDAVTRVAVSGQWWTVHEECAALITGG